MKIRETIRQIEADGWFHLRTSGSHRQYHHATKHGTVTIGDDLPAIRPSGTRFAS